MAQPLASASPPDDPADWAAARKAGVRIQANVVVEPRNWRAWLKVQLLGINWATLSILIAVLAVSSNISAQLDQQRAQAISAQRDMERLGALLSSATAISSQLETAHAALREYNATLQLALSLGVTNLTTDIHSLSNSLRAYQRAPTFCGFSAEYVTGAANGYASVNSICVVQCRGATAVAEGANGVGHVCTSAEVLALLSRNVTTFGQFPVAASSQAWIATGVGSNNAGGAATVDCGGFTNTAVFGTLLVGPPEYASVQPTAYSCSVSRPLACCSS